jgi:hypothetical protein
MRAGGRSHDRASAEGRHRMRFIIAGDLIIPAFDPRRGNAFADAKRIYPSIQLRVGF